METFDVKVVEAPACGLQPMAEQKIQSLSEKYESRGLAVSVLAEAEAQERAEAETRGASPDAYRLSLMSEAVKNGQWRRGKELMDAGDLVRYFDETREKRIATTDFTEEHSVYELATPDETERAVMVPSGQPFRRRARVGAHALAEYAGEKWVEVKKTWFDFSAPKTDREDKRFPLSAFAATLAVAVSMMLIIASSVMLTRAESNVSRLNAELAETRLEVNELRSDLEAKHDMLEIRDIAINEYGMVPESYVRMEYLTVGEGDKIEAFEEERRPMIGLDAILSAIGIKK